MSSDDKLEMIGSALNYLEKHSTLKWAHSFLKDLKRSHEPVNKLKINFKFRQILVISWVQHII